MPATLDARHASRLDGAGRRALHSRPRGRAARAVAWIAGACAGALCGCSEPAPQSPAPAAARRDILLVTIDTLRADRMGLYGYERDTTPAIDRFFAQATVFDRATASAPCTIPSVQQMLTGRMIGFETAPSLAEILAGAGYRTAAIVSQNQFRHGRLPWFRRGFESFDVQGLADVDAHRLSTRNAEDVTDRALALLDAARDEAPLFLWLHYFDPHDPYWPPTPARVFGPDGASPHRGDRRALANARAEGRRGARLRPSFSHEEADGFRDLYDEEIAQLDAQLGRIFDRLASQGRLERIVVVLTADHGERLGEDGLWDHCKTLAAEELHVPLLVRVDGGPLGAVRRDAAIASTLDVLPTVSGLAGVEVDLPEGLGGVDLRQAPPERTLVGVWNGAEVIRQGRFSLHRRGGVVQLFEAGDAPGVLERRAQPDEETEARLGSLLDAATVELGEADAANRQTLEQLEALGYIQ